MIYISRKTILVLWPKVVVDSGHIFETSLWALLANHGVLVSDTITHVLGLSSS
jgi:hypothetical protein